MNTGNVDHDDTINEVDDLILKEELQSFKLFLVDCELEKARHKFLSYAVKNLKETVVNEMLEHFFNSLKFAAKVMIEFGFILKNIEDGGIRFFFTHTKTIPCGIDPNLCPQGRLGKAKRCSQQNWRHLVM